MFGALGTSHNQAVHRYMNQRKVPQLFVSTGATRWGDPKNFPWTMGWQPTYQLEGRTFAQHILATRPQAKVAVLMQNGHLGLGSRGQDVLGEGAAFELVGGLPAHGPGEVLRIAPARGARGDEQLGHLALVHVAMHGLVVRGAARRTSRSEEHTSELQSQSNLVCRL